MKLSSMKKAKNKKGSSSKYLLHFTSIEAFLGMLSPWMNLDKKEESPYLTLHATVFSKMKFRSIHYPKYISVPKPTKSGANKH